MMQQIFTGHSAGRNNKKGISLKVFFSFLEKCPASRTVPLNPFPTEVTPEPTGCAPDGKFRAIVGAYL